MDYADKDPLDFCITVEAQKIKIGDKILMDDDFIEVEGIGYGSDEKIHFMDRLGNLIIAAFWDSDLEIKDTRDIRANSFGDLV